MSSRQPLAVIGYAYRAPGVGRKGLFEFLEQGKSAWSKIPPDRFNHEAYYHPDSRKPGFISSQGGHFLPDDLYAFDPAFFNIKADEARSMDPQHRLLLECAFEAAENAGVTLPELFGAKVGVFAAGDKSEYYNSGLAEDLHTTNIFTATGVNPCFFANRVSYFFGLKGPSVSVDAACASSSYAVHLACQSILSGECSAAFVGGAKTLNGPKQWIELDTMGTLSPEGKCFSYDTRASGFGRGEGAACLLIKPLSEALAGGDPIRCIIRNSAANHSGRSPGGISVPSRQAQEELLTRLHVGVGLDFTDTTYAEGHGTGTSVGDPIEASAIASAVASGRSPSNPLYLGSVKSNLGHIENASGLFSLIKCIMMLERKTLLPSANFVDFNPKIEGSERLKVLNKSMPWLQVGDEARRVFMCNFGFGGSNAALLLEAAPTGCVNGNHANGYENGHTNGHTNEHSDEPDGSDKTSTSEFLFVVSAKSPGSLEANMSTMKDYVKSKSAAATPSSSLQLIKDLAFTLGQRRTHFPYRVAVHASSLDSLHANLEATRATNKSGVIQEPLVAFIFTGQGAQHFEMGRGLRRYPAYDQALLDVEAILTRLGAKWKLTDELTRGEQDSRVHNNEISHPACAALQLALVALMDSWGIRPRFVLGHSSGEVAAAYSAGILSFEAAVAVSYFRGLADRKILADSSAVSGGMLALGTSAQEANRLFLHNNPNEYAVVAAINSPKSVTISGDASAIDSIQELAEEQHMFVRRLKVSVAYHSRHMERVADSFLADIEPYFSSSSSDSAAGKVRGDKRPTFISTVTGQVQTSIDARHWIKHLIQPVQYAAAVENLMARCRDVVQDHGNMPTVLVEMGPHSALQSPTKQILDSIFTGADKAAVSQPQCLASLVRGRDAASCLLTLAGKLFVMGSDIHLDAINRTDSSCARVLHDLPPYEWNKSTRYLHRPRVAAEKLFGGIAYNKLLGWKSPYGEGAELVYRNVFTLDNLPWIRDHRVAGDVLFPFSGFVSLAIEALRLQVTPAMTCHTVMVRELHVTAGLRIEEDHAVDVTTKIRPAETGTKTTSSTTWAFEILSWTDGRGWIRHAKGLIAAETGQVGGMNEDNEHCFQSRSVQAALETLHDQTLQQRNMQHEYGLLEESSSVHYGPAFRRAVDLWQGPQVVVHTVALRDQMEPNTAMCSPNSMVTVDPPTLDAFLQSFGALQERDHLRPILVPSFCLQWRMANEVAVEAGAKLSVVSRRLSYDEKLGNMEVEFVVFVTGSQDFPPKPIAVIGPMRFQCIARPNEQNMRLPYTFCNRHVPHVNLIDQEALASMIERDIPDNDGSVEHAIQQRQGLDQTALYFLSLATKTDHDMSGAPAHLADFVAWAKTTLSRHPAQLKEMDATFLESVSASNALGQLITTIGQQLPDILRGKKQALEIMLQDGLLWRTYAENAAGLRANRALAGYMGRLLDCTPDLDVLELGAGTGSATVPVLEAFEERAARTASRFTYTFTDISASFFDKAREKLAPWVADRIRYSKLDISQDPTLQGFELGTYDVVVASNVLHATSNILTSLTNCRRLLKPGGKLVLMEVVEEAPPCLMPYALLDGWWLFEDDYRSPHGPLLSKASWDSALRAAGFSGLAGHVDDFPGREERLFAALWSTAVEEDRGEERKEQEEKQVMVVHQCSADAESDRFCAALLKIISSSGCVEATVQPISQAEERRGGDNNNNNNNNNNKALSIVVDGGQAHSIFKNDMSSDRYLAIKSILLKSSRLLWVLPHKACPEASMIRGLLRSLRLESPSSKLLLLQAPQDDTGVAAAAKLVQCLMTADGAADDVSLEQEYMLIDNCLHVPRLEVLEGTQQIFAMEAGLAGRKEERAWGGGGQDNLQLTVETVGDPDSIHFRSFDFDTELGDDEIMVRVEAAGINFLDLLLVLGSLPWSPPGLEGAGVVTQVGSRVWDLQVGNRVFFAVDKAAMATSVRMPRLCAHRIPSGLDGAEAASMPVAYSTAILSLMDIGRLKPDESVLIHSTSGAIGQACLQVARHMGAGDIFVTAGTPKKRTFLAESYRVPTSRIFSSRTPEFKEGILRATGGRGVDVVVNCLSGDLLRQTWELMADGGRFVEIGKKDLVDNSSLPMRNFAPNVTFSAVDLRRIITADPARVQGYLSQVARMVEAGTITPVRPISKVSMAQVGAGLRKLQAGQNIGKVVIVPSPNDQVLVEQPSRLRKSLSTGATVLRPDATYIIAGGTGGIGRALVAWMLEKGARNVVMLGRSAQSNAKVQAILRRYEGSSNVCVRAIPCDVGVRDDILAAAKAIGNLPKVRGVVHAAMCLRDGVFANLKHEDWQLTIKSRIDAAWNMHELFPDLDFFVALGAITGVTGNGGQSVYTGTSTFLEAFTEHRLSLGLPTSVIHLPAVSNIGYVAEQNLTQQLKKTIGGLLRGSEALAVIEGAILGPQSGLAGVGGRSLAWSLVPTSEVPTLPWEHFRPLSVMRRLRSSKSTTRESNGASAQIGGGGGGKQLKLDSASPDEIADALADKVSAMTAIDRAEVTLERSLAEYGLDSLISLEFRDWIRRNFDLGLVVDEINQSRDLKVILDRIVAHVGAR